MAWHCTGTWSFILMTHPLIGIMRVRTEERERPWQVGVVQSWHMRGFARTRVDEKESLVQFLLVYFLTFMTHPLICPLVPKKGSECKALASYKYLNACALGWRRRRVWRSTWSWATVARTTATRTRPIASSEYSRCMRSVYLYSGNMLTFFGFKMLRFYLLC